MSPESLLREVHTAIAKARGRGSELTDGEVRMRILDVLLASEGPLTLDRDEQRMLVALTVRRILAVPGGR